MDPLSISTACLALLGGIGKTTFAVTDFVRGYRAARSDLTALTGELTQLQLVLELIKDDTAVSDDKIIPTSLQSQVLAIIKNCFSVMEKVDTVLENHKGTSGPVKWVVSGKTEVNGLLMSLEAHRASLSLVVDLVSLAVSKAVKQDTSAIRAQVTDIKQDTSLIPELMDEVMRLRAIIGGGDIPSTSRGQNFVLQQYLDGLTSYAETVCNDIECDLPNESRSGESRTLSHEDLISFSEPSIAGPTQGDPIHLQVRASPSAARGEWTSPGESPTPSLPAAPSSEPTSPAITVENPLRSEVVYVDCGPSLSPKQPPPAGQKSEDSSSDVAITRARKNERTTTLRDIFHVLKRISAPVIPKNVVLLNACGYGSCGISSLIVRICSGYFTEAIPAGDMSPSQKPLQVTARRVRLALNFLDEGTDEFRRQSAVIDENWTMHTAPDIVLLCFFDGPHWYPASMIIDEVKGIERAHPNVPIMPVRLKSDLGCEPGIEINRITRKFSGILGSELRLRGPVSTCSSKSGFGVENLANEISDRLAQVEMKKGSSPVEDGSRGTEPFLKTNKFPSTLGDDILAQKWPI